MLSKPVPPQGPVAQKIWQKLTDAFAPQYLALDDDSARHSGHAGHKGHGESHFKLVIVSVLFEGLSRVERHRRVHDVLAEELKGQIHALQLKILTPSEQ